MENKNKESNLEKRTGFGNLIKNKVKKGFETAYKSCKSTEAQFLFSLLLSMGVCYFGANEYRKAREYTSNNSFHERVQTIDNQLNAETTFQYKDIGQLCDNIYQKQEQVQELIAERDSITQLPIYQQQTKKIEQAKTLRQIGFAGLFAGAFALLSFPWYIIRKNNNNEGKKKNGKQK